MGQKKEDAIVVGNRLQAYEFVSKTAFLPKIGAMESQLARLNPGSRVLSIGPGAAQVETALTKNGYEVHTIDLNWQGLVSAKQQLPSISALQANTLNLPYKNESMPLIWAGTVGHEIYSINGADGMIAWYKEMGRVLEKDGEIVIRDSNAPENADKVVTVQLLTQEAKDFAIKYLELSPLAKENEIQIGEGFFTSNLKLAADFAFHLSWIPKVKERTGGDLTDFYNEEVPQIYSYGNISDHEKWSSEAGLSIEKIEFQENEIGKKVIGDNIKIIDPTTNLTIDLPTTRIVFSLKHKNESSETSITKRLLENMEPKDLQNLKKQGVLNDDMVIWSINDMDKTVYQVIEKQDDEEFDLSGHRQEEVNQILDKFTNTSVRAIALIGPKRISKTEAILTGDPPFFPVETTVVGNRQSVFADMFSIKSTDEADRLIENIKKQINDSPDSDLIILDEFRPDQIGEYILIQLEPYINSTHQLLVCQGGSISNETKKIRFKKMGQKFGLFGENEIIELGMKPLNRRQLQEVFEFSNGQGNSEEIMRSWEIINELSQEIPIPYPLARYLFSNEGIFNQGIININSFSVGPNDSKEKWKIALHLLLRKRDFGEIFTVDYASQKYDMGLQKNPTEIITEEAKPTLMLAIAQPEVDELLSEISRTRNLQIKDNFHISVINNIVANIIDKKLQEIPEEEKTAVLLKIRKLAETVDWSYTLKNEYYHISKDYPESSEHEEIENREAIIQIINIPGMEVFYSELGQLLGLDLVVPIAHITLFTKSNISQNKGLGIAVYSSEDFSNLNPKKLT